jgi:hypothetical protein
LKLKLSKQPISQMHNSNTKTKLKSSSQPRHQLQGVATVR